MTCRNKHETHQILFSYGYDPLHIHGEISMFLTFNSKTILVKNTCIYEIQNRLNRKPNVLNLYVCVCELEHINTSLSYTRSKHKFKLDKLKYSCRTPSPNRLDPNTIQRA